MHIWMKKTDNGHNFDPWGFVNKDYVTWPI